MNKKDELYELLDTLYRDHCTGGPLHCEIDDGNLEGVLSPMFFFEDYEASLAGQTNFHCLEYVCKRICSILNEDFPDESVREDLINEWYSTQQNRTYEYPDFIFRDRENNRWDKKRPEYVN